MAKLTAWLVALLGAWMVLGLLGVSQLAMGTALSNWATAIIVLIIGIGKLMRNYAAKGKKR